MMKPKNEFSALLCSLYMIALLAALPLYTGEGYWRLGESKYLLFRNVTAICLGSWLLAGMPGRLRAMAAWRNKQLRQPFSGADCAVAAYGICVTLSALFSSYSTFPHAPGGLAWLGYEGWYMGAVSQLFFAGIYFFVSRQYDGAGYPLYLGEAALGAVTALGLLHRLGIDPLGLHRAYNSGDWEYSHMISTLGNINWLCGFYSVALAFPLAHFLREEERSVRPFLYVLNTAAFLLLLIQGSYSGLLIPASAVCLCLWMGRKRITILRRILAVLAGAFLLMPVWERMMRLAGNKAAMAADGNLFAVTVWYGWALAAAACLILLLCTYWVNSNAIRHIVSALVPAGLALGLLAGIALLCRRGFDDGFGSGRGFLWRISVESFGQAGWKDRLLGAGPDCYGEAVFQKYAAAAAVWKGEYWENAVFTNAHSEILSQLLNIGILGTLAYGAVFAVGLYRYRKLPLGLLALVMYGVHSLVSFQQVLNTPLLFLTLGICESILRRQEAYGSLPVCGGEGVTNV